MIKRIRPIRQISSIPHAPGSHGFTSSMPVTWKSAVLRVARVRQWTLAVAAMKESFPFEAGSQSLLPPGHQIMPPVPIRTESCQPCLAGSKCREGGGAPKLPGFCRGRKNRATKKGALRLPKLLI